MNQSAHIRNQKAAKLMSLMALLFLLIAVFGTRIWPAYDYIFSDLNQVKLLGVDSLFHLRHAKYTLDNYPEIQRLDIGASYPEARPNEATGLFGLTISTAVLLIFGKGASLNDIALVASWLTPTLSVISCLLIFLLVRQLVNTRIALLAALFFFLYPGKSLDRSVLGFVDHHAAEYCLSLAIALGLVSLLNKKSEQSATVLWKGAIIASLPLILLFHTWQGAALPFLLVMVALLVCWNFTVITRGDITAVTSASACYGIVLLLAVLLTKRETLLIIGASLLIVGACAYMRIFQTLTNDLVAKVVSICISVFAFIGTASLAYFTELGRFLSNLVFSPSVNLIHEEKAVSLTTFLTQFGVVGILAISAFLLIPMLVKQRQMSVAALVPLVLGGLWLVIWWSSGDFDYLVPVFVAVNAALVVYSLRLIIIPRILPFYIFNNTISRIAGYTIGFGMLVLPIYPLNIVSLPWVDQSKLTAMTIYSNDWYSSLAWLKQNTPQPARTPLTNVLGSEHFEGREMQDYGVLVAWDFGNIVASHGNRIPVWSSLPTTYTPQWFLAQNEQESLDVLSQRSSGDGAIRYVIVDKDTYGPLIHAKSKFTDNPVSAVKRGTLTVNGKQVPYVTLDDTHQNSILTRLYAKDGNKLSHYRMVYESAEQSFSAGFLQASEQSETENYHYVPKVFPIGTSEELERYEKWMAADVVETSSGYLYDGKILSAIKIYEVVKGTTINGNATPGDLIEARLQLYSKTTGRQFVYKRSGVADERGYFEFVVPYSTDKDLPHSDIIATGEYQLWVRKKGNDKYVLQATLKVPEATFKERKLPFLPQN